MAYESWVAGFSTTQDVQVDATDDDSAPGQVEVTLIATQTDGTVKTFTGTYTVADGEIVSADVQEQ
jgi:hypothetical protein